MISSQSVCADRGKPGWAELLSPSSQPQKCSHRRLEALVQLSYFPFGQDWGRRSSVRTRALARPGTTNHTPGSCPASYTFVGQTLIEMWTRLVKQLRNDAESFAKSLMEESLDPQIWRATSTRLATYQPEAHKRPLDCPYCWIIEGEKRSLQPVPGPTQAIACSTCGSEYPLE